VKQTAFFGFFTSRACNFDVTLLTVTWPSCSIIISGFIVDNHKIFLVGAGEGGAEGLGWDLPEV